MAYRKSQNSFGTLTSMEVDGQEYSYFDLGKLAAVEPSVVHLPYALKILLENLLRNEDGVGVTAQDIQAFLKSNSPGEPPQEIAFSPSRVVLQDFTGVPAVVDLAGMRDAMVAMGGDPGRINPQVPVELVIDHSVQVDVFGRNDALRLNLAKEFERNLERYTFLRWGQQAFRDFKVVPPGTGIVHQVNLEFLARVVFEEESAHGMLAYPDTLVGTDSHTTMINGLGVLGWGVGGIEAEAAMLGQPITLLVPPVVGFNLLGRLPGGATATDLVLTVTKMLREHGVVEKFVEFHGPGLTSLSLADRATLGNMSPEYGATCAIFPIDQQTLDYLRLTARSEKRIRLIERYAKVQGLFHNEDSLAAEYDESLELDLSSVEPCLAGPSRPQDQVYLKDLKQSFQKVLPKLLGKDSVSNQNQQFPVVLSSNGAQTSASISHGSVVIAAITSCTNTSNPSVMVGAGLLAKKAVERGLRSKPWVKTSLAPGSKVVTEYLQKAGLTPYLDQLGFNLVGYGCTTCIGNSGPLPASIAEAVGENQLVVCSVLSGNRNFEGRISPHVRASYLASPPLVVAYALAGRIDLDVNNEPLGVSDSGEEVFLHDLWPSPVEVQEAVAGALNSEMFEEKYSDVFSGDERWRELPTPTDLNYAWEESSTYIHKPPFFDGMSREPERLEDLPGMRVLAVLGDSVTTDHISPAGAIPADGPAGQYLLSKGFSASEFNSFGSRRGNHEVMIRGTFGNIRLRNFLVEGVEGSFTRMPPSEEVVPIYQAAEEYRREGTPLLVLAGKEYGSGSSRDWAAKGTSLLGVRAVLAESYERIHRSNLVGMGVLPLQFEDGQNRESLGLIGDETYGVEGIQGGFKPGSKLVVSISRGGEIRRIHVVARIDTPNEMEYYLHGGILQYVLRGLVE